MSICYAYLLVSYSTRVNQVLVSVRKWHVLPTAGLSARYEKSGGNADQEHTGAASFICQKSAHIIIIMPAKKKTVVVLVSGSNGSHLLAADLGRRDDMEVRR